MMHLSALYHACVDRIYAEHIRERSSRLYGRPRAQVEEAIRDRLARLQARQDPTYYDE